MVVFAVISFISGIVLCCCGKKALRRKKTPYSFHRKLITFILFCFSVFSIFVCVITGLKSNSTFTVGINSLIDSVNLLFQDAESFGTGLTPVVSNTFDAASEGVYQFTVDLSDSIVGGIEGNPGLSQEIDRLIMSVTRMHSYLQSSYNLGDTVETQNTLLESQAAQFKAGILENTSITDKRCR